MDQNLRGDLSSKSMEINSLICSGGLFLAKDTKRFLFLLRNNPKSQGQWGLVGGKKEPNDLTPFEILKRESNEEVGKIPEIKKIVPLDFFISTDQSFQYNTYVIIVEKEFQPQLNDEHAGYCWVDYEMWPNPLHRGLKNSFNNKIIRAKLDLLLILI
jgi:8-oxo-dGTP pyrophosphatase MutT (NUDIX family)